eukprot:GILJ01004444.1.p1 GENE.GILJ01004444.1~~GILJ01004444.1.p1  ORF type:complete len:441 (-),score=64.35 GILJ01004444.1:81-1370(-)
MKVLVLVAVLLSAAVASSVSENDVTSVDAQLDPDVSRTIAEVIAAKGYPVEAHEISTEDGYILTAFRIPHGRAGKNNAPAPPVLLQHGLLDSSVTWVFNTEEQSLGFILADKGYDVWLLNNRGNKYSLGHKTLTSNKRAFWQFTFDEMAQYDVKANIDYIRARTGFDKVSYIGHSQGTIQMFAALSLDPSLEDKLVSFVGLGPLISLHQERNWMLRALANVHIDELVRWFGIESFLIPNSLSSKILPGFCALLSGLCELVIDSFCGWNNGSFNRARMAFMAAQEPGGTSVQNVVHWGQALRTGVFKRFDYGSSENIARYGQKDAPLYAVENLKTLRLPIYLFSGTADLLADEKDVKDLMPLLAETAVHESIEGYAHLDFCWAVTANEKVYSKILPFLETSLNNDSTGLRAKQTVPSLAPIKTFLRTTAI